jgi:hypothetical protein
LPLFRNIFVAGRNRKTAKEKKGQGKKGQGKKGQGKKGQGKKWSRQLVLTQKGPLNSKASA